MLKHLQLLVLILCGLVSLIGCGTDNPTTANNMDIDLDSVDLALLLNSSAGQEFTANPWDVNMDNKINLLDLFLVNQNIENALAPAVGLAVKGDLKQGTKLSNGFYELELIDYTKGNYAALKITNVGNSSGLLTNLSGANFKVVSGGISNFVDLYWLGSIDLGESIVWRFHSTAMVNQMTGATAGLDKIVFQASSNMMFTQRSDYDHLATPGANYRTLFEEEYAVYEVTSSKVDPFNKKQTAVWKGGGAIIKPDYLGSHVIAIPIGEKIGAPIVFE